MDVKEPMMTLRTGRIRNHESCRVPGFTLIELILVMALLLIVVGVALPSLKGFFRGRNLDSEARRFLSLTRYGQTRAVSEGVPMVLWMDPRRGAYGLQQQAGYTDGDSNAVRFGLSEELRMEVQTPVVAAQTNPLNQTMAGTDNTPMIRFTPDGFIGETSPERIGFRQGKDDPIWIVESTNRLKYEIQANDSPKARR
ncbi:MAG: type II secretion system protein GspH [Verrucomicrobia bacterium]|nr:MAG: type II secretion system protein GspH [Verrucomicrobiota bacterium]